MNCPLRLITLLVVLLPALVACGGSEPPVEPEPPRPVGPQEHPDLQEKYRDAVRQLEELGAVVVVQDGVPVEVDAGSAGVAAERLDRVLQLVLQLDTLRRLYLTGQHVSGSQLEPLARLPQLESLNLDSVPHFSDQDLQSLVRLKHLKVLTLRGTGVSAQGVSRLRKACPELLVTY